MISPKDDENVTNRSSCAQTTALRRGDGSAARPALAGGITWLGQSGIFATAFINVIMGTTPPYC
jgi:hypothetical protein